MKLELINFLLFSDKRKNFLLSLEDGAKSIDEVLNLLQIPRVSLLPQIKKLKEEGLIIQEGDNYRLSTIGNILVRKAHPLLNVIRVFEENEYFWSQRKLDTIPVPFLRRIGELKKYKLIGSGVDNWSNLFPESIEKFESCEEFMLLFSEFHSSIPSFCLELAKKGVNLRLVLSKNSLKKLSKDFRSEGEQILAQESGIILVKNEEAAEIPASIAVTESKLLLGIINKKGKFEGQYILCSDPSALSWGKELFEFYVDRSRRVSVFDFLEGD